MLALNVSKSGGGTKPVIFMDASEFESIKCTKNCFNFLIHFSVIFRYSRKRVSLTFKRSKISKCVTYFSFVDGSPALYALT